ncbi:hypothetical protein F2Q68_00035700 [Brassica cretica]|uniref:Uncharacterized protein n=1 Tax=Brassica cretica TaxID=69181 RepID=A0A8S9GUP5_BRACR|nr:hypothetical protein F2Q68_00035700 [Brassica cretica]
MCEETRDSPIDTWALIGAVLDAVTLRKPPSSPCPPGVGFIGLSVLFGLLPEYICLSKHELPFLEEGKRGFYGSTYRVIPMDLMLASVEAECWRKSNLPEDEEEEENLSAPPVSSTPPMNPNARPVKLMPHGSIMALSVV